MKIDDLQVEDMFEKLHKCTWITDKMQRTGIFETPAFPISFATFIWRGDTLTLVEIQVDIDYGCVGWGWSRLWTMVVLNVVVVEVEIGCELLLCLRLRLELVVNHCYVGCGWGWGWHWLWTIAMLDVVGVEVEIGCALLLCWLRLRLGQGLEPDPRQLPPIPSSGAHLCKVFDNNSLSCEV